MKLYKVPNNTKIRLLEDGQVPPAAPQLYKGDELLFCKIDGAHSVCYKGKQLVHLAAWSEVEIIK